jgi:hypothetical protein
MRPSVVVKACNLQLLLCLVAFSGFGSRPAQAQSLTSGSLRGVVQTADGEPVSGASVTLESRAGSALMSLESDREGGFTAQLLTPGQYRLLVEQIGYQPLRSSGVIITAGTTTYIVLTVERRPPPITSVTEVTNPGVRGGSAAGFVLSGSELTPFDRPADLGGLGRLTPSLITPGDGRAGLGLGSGGFPISESRLFVDGVLETMLRHPGFRAEPLSAPLFQRGGLNQVHFLGIASDAEWRGVPGMLVSGQSRTGAGRRFSIAPYASFSSAKLGQSSLDNPGDSSGTSFQLGASLNAAIVPDTAHLFIEGGYQSLEQPTARPWGNDVSSFGGQPASLATQVPAIGIGTYQTALGVFAAPVVRTWKGGHGQARLDWQLGPTNHLMARFGYATWKEGSPQLGADPFFGTGTSLKARDISGAVGLTTSSGAFANELRGGFSMARREWLGSPVAGTILSNDGIAFGTSPVLPATFDVKRVDISNAIQFVRGPHRLKGGVSLNILSHDQDYRYGASGLFHFGDLDRFAQGQGTYFQVAGTPGSARYTVTTPGVFLEDTWSASPDFQLQLGARYETQVFPKTKISADTSWFNASGVSNIFTPDNSSRVSPRIAFTWSLRSNWVIRGSGGLYQGELDPSLFAEAMLFDGGSTVRRGLGLFPSWPSDPGGAAPTVGKRLTLFSDEYRAPRIAKFDFGFARSFGGGTTFSAGGSYSHSDFLLRRQDLNRADAGGRATQEGRLVYGTLVKQGGLVSAAPESNRLFDTHDLVFGLAPTGFVDHYEINAGLAHRVSRGVSVDVAYTYGKTTDNLVGLLQADPADQLDPFPEGLPGGGDWSSGRSDLDITHRVAASAEYRSSGSRPIVFGARWRWRSGLPFTPGFRPGVDLNGDGGGNNDPVLTPQGGLTGCPDAQGGEFAPRNSCREDGVHALDLRFSIGLPVTFASGGNVFLTVDGFNLVSSSSGLIDKAALLIDPAGQLGTGTGGSVVVPFTANPGFGTLLSRRVEPRLLRVGLKMEY